MGTLGDVPLLYSDVTLWLWLQMSTLQSILNSMFNYRAVNDDRGEGSARRAIIIIIITYDDYHAALSTNLQRPHHGCLSASYQL
jgi:hypothetical protein